MIKRWFDSLITPSNIIISNNNEQKCANYENEIKNKLDSTKKLLEVFYSPVTQTCLYTIEQFNIIEVNDYLKQENLLRFDSEVRCTEIRWKDTNKLETCNKIYQEEITKLRELKWE